MKTNPDDRRDNVERIQCAIDHTIANIEAAEEMIATCDCEQTKAELRAKNERRHDSLRQMRSEIQDEACARENKK